MRSMAPISSSGFGGSQPGWALRSTVSSSGELAPDASSASKRPQSVPRATPETQRYWDGAAAGELWIQRCTPEQHAFFYQIGRASCRERV